METNDRSLVTFTSLAHALFHTYELSIPLFVGLWMAEFEVSAAVIGAVVGVGYAFIGLGAPVSGILADRVSSRRLIFASIVGMGIGFGLVAFARGVITLGIAILLWGSFASIYHPAGLSLISRTAEERGTVFGYHGAGGNVGTALGPLVTAILLIFVDWRIAAAVLSVVAILVGAVGTRVSFETAAIESGGSGSFADEIHRMWNGTRALFGVAFTVAIVAVLLYGTYYRGLLTFLPDVLAEAPTLSTVELMGRAVEPSQYVYTSLLTVGIGGQFVGGRLTDKIHSTSAFVFFLATLGVLALVFPVARTSGTVAIVVVSLLLGFFVYGTAPIYQVVIAEQADSEVQGLSYGFTYLAMFGVGAVGASMAGFVLTRATSTALFGVLAVIASLGVGAVLLLRQL